MLKSAIQRFAIAALGVAFCATFILAAPSTAHAASPAEGAARENGSTANAQAMIQRINPYVTVSSAFIASLAPSAYQHLNTQDVTYAQAAIAKYNALPRNDKDPQVIDQSVNSDIGGLVPLNGITQSNATVQPFANTCSMTGARAVDHPQWWGNQWYVNDCFIYWMNPVNIITLGGVGALVAIGCGTTAICIVFGALLASYIGILYFALDHDTSSCGNRGAYINAPWTGTPWPSPVC